MSLHTWYCLGPRKPSNCATFMLNSHWGRATTGKNKSCVYARSVALVMSNSLQPCRPWPARFPCQGSSPGKNTRAYWPYWLPYPSRVLYFLMSEPQLP